jgi:ABC-2 type transport system permease protein
LAIVLLPPTVPVTVIALPLVMFVQILFTVGLAMLVACGSVYFRDVPKLVQIIGTLMFFLTPIFYPLDFIPEALRSVIRINLMAPIITFYHNILYDKTWPAAESLVLTGLTAMAFFILGIWIFNRKKHAFAELT